MQKDVLNIRRNAEREKERHKRSVELKCWSKKLRRLSRSSQLATSTLSKATSLNGKKLPTGERASGSLIYLPLRCYEASVGPLEPQRLNPQGAKGGSEGGSTGEIWEPPIFEK